MKNLLLLLFLSILSINPIFGAQNLLQRVKNNPNEAIKLCAKLRDFNSKGISASDEKAIKDVATKKGLNQTDAEIYASYAIGIHCPDVN